MPTFLSADQLYRLLQRESPEDCFPDGPASAFFSTADQFSVGQVIADSYANLSIIYDNYFPNIAVDRLADFEMAYFGYTLDSSLTVTERRTRLLSKIRSRRRTTPDDMLATVYTVIDSSIQVEIAEWNTTNGGWVLDESELDISTVLVGGQQLQLTGPNLCQLDAADYGLSEADYLILREDAYTYDVRIYSYTLTAGERQQLEKLLTQNEPARSQHKILDGLDPADMIGGST